LGVFTLISASFFALVESDTKKVVALSTLSQLGLIFIALSLGGLFICLFHLLIHAFSKANLFLIIGNLIHSRFSEQDIRFINKRERATTFYFIIFVRIMSLSGVLFISGFFSKDFILINEPYFSNSIIEFIISIYIVSLTLAYCYKLIAGLTKKTSVAPLGHVIGNIISLYPSFFLRRLRILRGYFFSINFFLLKLGSNFTRGIN
jgi:NADH-quinone oxidoreductase subunit L